MRISLPCANLFAVSNADEMHNEANTKRNAQPTYPAIRKRPFRTPETVGKGFDLISFSPSKIEA
jgi:hypothetical protein